LTSALRANVLGEATPKTPIPAEIPETKSFGRKIKAVPAWGDAKIRNWFFDRGEDAERAIEEAAAWLKSYHPGYATVEKYARRRQVRSTPGQQPLPALGDAN